MSQFRCGGQCDAVQRCLAGTVGQVPNRGVGGERDDASTGVLALGVPRESADEQPGCSRVDREVTIEALDGGVNDPAGDRFAVTHHERLDTTKGLHGKVEYLVRSPRIVRSASIATAFAPAACSSSTIASVTPGSPPHGMRLRMWRETEESKFVPADPQAAVTHSSQDTLPEGWQLNLKPPLEQFTFEDSRCSFYDYIEGNDAIAVKILQWGVARLPRDQNEAVDRYVFDLRSAFIVD
jgi:hypothetical protein